MKHYFTIAILMATGTAYAQSPDLYDCIYRYQVNGEVSGKEINETTDCILQIGENTSKFYDYAIFRLDSVSSIPGISEEMRAEREAEAYKRDTFFDQTLLTTLSDNKLTVYSDMVPDHYKYEQNLPIIEWNLTEETDSVCGYECRKANGNYGGRDWIVWYTEEIPVPFGPWKMIGLPGLVLKAVADNGIHSFEAITFRKGNDKITKPSVPNVNTISHEKFIQRKNIYDLDPMSSINSENISEITIMPNESILINGLYLRQHKNGSIPLEYTDSEIKKLQKGEKLQPQKRPQEEIKVIEVGTRLKNS